MSDERSEQRLCPLKQVRVSVKQMGAFGAEHKESCDEFLPCEGDRCAWWTCHGCAVVAIGAVLNLMVRPAPMEEAGELRRAGQW